MRTGVMCPKDILPVTDTDTNSPRSQLTSLPMPQDKFSERELPSCQSSQNSGHRGIDRATTII